MTRACWRCAEPIEDTLSRCPGCGARVIPADSGRPTPAQRARTVRIIALICLASLVLLLIALAWG
jgi:hypothetical protein